jgi:hypothetical protein
MATNKYLLTAATLAGVAVGSIGVETLTAKASVPLTHRVCAEQVYTRAQVAGATGQQMASTLCGLIDTQAELPPGLECELDDLEEMLLLLNTQHAPDVLLRGCANLAGSWVPGEAE